MIRGINVSGQKKIKMADLKAHMEDLGFSEVQTYIQSGNIIFRVNDLRPEKIEHLISYKIKKEYGWEVPVIVRSTEEIKIILKDNPYLDKKDPNRLFVTFLTDEPLLENFENLHAVDYSPEEYRFAGKDIYLYLPNGYGKARMNNNFFEKKLKVSATTRNWKTLNSSHSFTFSNR